ncbi:CoA protein activase [Sporohalobacter salinus]|uniref:CoA protein activase n=1 Tax=Sporohalobacter salinus TaxID=1494606 RepID=UPI00195FBE2E|nr:CoA protein activase [Sporohalobacter salinus]MBM7622871.1 putative nucleotide-binding protein (sugar kinase/HSP70/actin superfamily) [Sporohalobacter salinus]
MLVAFPQMGDFNIPLESLFNNFEIDTLSSPPLTKKTLDLGVQYAPESSCLPFKLVLGSFIESLEEGAEALIIAGGNGPCRFGHFGELAKEVLESLGYEFEFYILEPPVSSIIETITELSSDFSWFKALPALWLAWKKLIIIEELKKYRLKAGIGLNRERSHKLDNKYLQLVSKAETSRELTRIKEKFQLELDKLVSVQDSAGVKIGLVGDIYTILEPFANLDIERRLNHLGAVVNRGVFLSDWIKENIIYSGLGLSKNHNVAEAAKDYLKVKVGGLGFETVGKTVLYGRQGYDGIIQLSPFGCMPEIVAKSALDEVEQDLELPVLNLVVDEHSSATGVQTRLEAFVDLLQRKKG